MVGEWNGKIEIPSSPLAVGVRISGEPSALKGEMDIPTQGAKAMPLGEVALAGSTLSFTVPDVPGASFRGEVAGDRIEGTFTQSGAAFPLVLAKGALPPAARPQEPKPPYPYRSEDVTFRSGDTTIAGTVTLPEGPGPFPAVVMITGSGPQDRNEELMGHKPFLLFADALTRAGYAVLRTDDRGVGGTGGVLTEATYDVLSADVVAGVEFLRARPDVKGDQIGLFGHSEGGYLAPLAAPAAKAAFTILMAGPGVKGDEILAAQTRFQAEQMGMPPEAVALQVQFSRDMSALLEAGDLEKARAFAREKSDELQASLPPEQRLSEEAVDAGIAQQTTPYFAALVGYDPAPALRALTVPVFAFFGDKDVQVPPAQSEGPTKAALAGNPDATVRVFPGLNHLMQPAQKGTVDEYGTNETSVSPEVLTAVTEWLTQRVPPA